MAEIHHFPGTMGEALNGLSKGIQAIDPEHLDDIAVVMRMVDGSMAVFSTHEDAVLLSGLLEAGKFTILQGSLGAEDEYD
jgi:hypothetical protein